MPDYVKLEVAKDLVLSDIASVLSLKQNSNDSKLKAAFDELMNVYSKVALGDTELIESVLKRHEAGGGICTLEDIQKIISG